MVIFKCSGGQVVVPDQLVLIDRSDGGTLIVLPPREVWDRSELSRDELVAWSFLVAATARAMIDALPQLEGGCVNYWDAGNWRLNELAEPVGPKIGRESRQLHMNLLGRSRFARTGDAAWGEAPKFPDFVDRLSWSSNKKPLTAVECRETVSKLEELLKAKYQMTDAEIDAWSVCPECGYPSTHSHECPIRLS